MFPYMANIVEEKSDGNAWMVCIGLAADSDSAWEAVGRFTDMLNSDNRAVYYIQTVRRLYGLSKILESDMPVPVTSLIVPDDPDAHGQSVLPGDGRCTYHENCNGWSCYEGE